MVYKVYDDFSDNITNNTDLGHSNTITLSAENGSKIELPDSSYVTDSDISRDGVDLVLETSEGTVVVEGYFASEPTPHLTSPEGMTLTPSLVNSFASGDNQYASSGQSANDVSPVGAIQEISGQATVTRLDGTVETAGIGTPIYQGDIIETDEDGAVNIMFIDETTFAVSEDARLAIDEYVFDPATQTGTTNFSVLKGVFVFTSGLIGREDPDDVMINTPSGSIGIRGTIIAGDVDNGEITVIEGAIVLYDFSGNTLTLSNQYETARFNPSESSIDHIGELEAGDVGSRFMSVSTVAADLFSSIEDSAAETSQDNAPQTQEATDKNPDKEASVTDNIDEQQQDAHQETAQNGDTQNSDTVADQTTIQTTIVTSDDITGSGLETVVTTVLNTDDNKDITTQLTPSGKSIAPTDDSNIGDITTPQLITPFTITVTKLTFTEPSGTTGGQVVARVTGNFTSLTKMKLLGISNNFYDITREDANNFLISVKAGVQIDAENPFGLYIGATNSSGATKIAQKIDLDIINIDEPITYDSALTPISSGTDNYFSGSQNTVLNYDISQNFNDPENQIVSYSFFGGAPTHADLSSATIDNNGNISFILDNSVTTDSSFTFIVEATDINSNNILQGFTFDIYGQTTTSSTIFTNSQTYTGNDENITIAANNIKVFSDIDNSNNTVNVGGTDAYIKTGAGDDTIMLNSGSTGYNAYGDLGIDVFKISEIQGKSYGGDGNDIFVIETTGALSQLQSSSAGTVINGGTGTDIIKFNTAGTIDFSAISGAGGSIVFMDTINTDNGSGNIINLSYSDVINISDNNVIKINMDSNDTLNFNNDSPSGNSFYNVSNINSNGENYDIYTDGIVTLLVDTEATNVTGL